ncbi:MAG: hypothetical protein V3V19_11220 [Cocleimonas sp.]
MSEKSKTVSLSDKAHEILVKVSGMRKANKRNDWKMQDIASECIIEKYTKGDQ